MEPLITDFQITRFEYLRDRVIGDAQVKSTVHHMGVLELTTSNGHTGTGFFVSLFHALPPLAELKRQFADEVYATLRGHNPFILMNRVSRPRGGNRVQPTRFAQAIDQALWDLQGQELGLPLYRLLGGTQPKVPVYASGLDFHLSDEAFTGLFQHAVNLGFRAFKMKVGHPSLEWDLERVGRLRGVVGKDAAIMVDANESWTPKEAIRRASAYHSAGFDILWIEDPCLRDDYDGLSHVVSSVDFCFINTGEYLDLSGKQRLLQHGAVDILNLHGHISESVEAARLAADRGIPVSIGNTPVEIGVHLAAALPEVMGMEYSFLNYDHMLEQPIRIEDGFAYVPDEPGHGLRLSDRARATYARPIPLTPEELASDPPVHPRLGFVSPKP